MINDNEKLFKILCGETLLSLTMENESEFLLETDKRVRRYTVGGDCCSSSFIESIDVPSYVIGQKITDARSWLMDDNDMDENVVLKIYNVSFATAKGTAVVDFRNQSNGYYGGYIESYTDSLKEVVVANEIENKRATK